MGQSSSYILLTFHEVVSNRYVGRVWLFISRLSPFRNLVRTQKAREKSRRPSPLFDILTGACITLFHPKKCDSPFSHFGPLFFLLASLGTLRRVPTLFFPPSLFQEHLYDVHNRRDRSVLSNLIYPWHPPSPVFIITIMFCKKRVGTQWERNRG